MSGWMTMQRKVKKMRRRSKVRQFAIAVMIPYFDLSNRVALRSYHASRPVFRISKSSHFMSKSMYQPFASPSNYE